eukprot:Tbor_TRINITY_DN3320_c0_g1::TRINITY_DN3320_c0_g1_i1::g.23518::m.23518
MTSRKVPGNEPHVPSHISKTRTNFAQKYANQKNRNKPETPPMKETAHSSCQTEVVLGLSYGSSIKDTYSNIHANAYRQLEELRETIKNTMDAVGGSVYDVLAYKDIMLQLADRIPNVPLVDLLLITSKLYRHCGDLSRLLQAFFQMVFSDGYTDDTFHFTDMRLMKSELKQLRKDITEMKIERDISIQKYEELSKGIIEHAHVVATLENRNDVLELRSSGLEDQIALLFSQVTDDFLFFNEEQYQKISMKQEVEEKMALTRSKFRQSIDDLQMRLELFQAGLSENSKVTENSLKAKVRQLNVHISQVISRFSAVKEGLFQTADELLSALRDKKKILNFSIQHIKMYDLQNAKLRSSRALMHEMRQRLSDLERAVTHTFTATSERMTAVEEGLGGVYVSRSGVISFLNDGDIDMTNHSISSSVSFQKEGNAPSCDDNFSTEYSSDVKHLIDQTNTCVNSPLRLKNIRELRQQIVELQDTCSQVTAALDTNNEQINMLKVISLATPSTARSYGQLGDGGVALTGEIPIPSLPTSSCERGVQPRGYYDFDSQGENETQNKVYLSSQENNEVTIGGQDTRSLMDHVCYSGSSRQRLRLSLELAQQKEDFTKKMEFMRAVYAEQISALESRIDKLPISNSQLQKKHSGSQQGLLSQRGERLSIISQTSAGNASVTDSVTWGDKMVDTTPIGSPVNRPLSSVASTSKTKSHNAPRTSGKLSTASDDLIELQAKETWIETKKRIFGSGHTDVEQINNNNGASSNVISKVGDAKSNAIELLKSIADESQQLFEEKNAVTNDHQTRTSLRGEPAHVSEEEPGETFKLDVFNKQVKSNSLSQVGGDYSQLTDKQVKSNSLSNSRIDIPREISSLQKSNSNSDSEIGSLKLKSPTDISSMFVSGTRLVTPRRTLVCAPVLPDTFPYNPDAVDGGDTNDVISRVDRLIAQQQERKV